MDVGPDAAPGIPEKKSLEKYAKPPKPLMPLNSCP
jgi:hypothetical protein